MACTACPKTPKTNETGVGRASKRNTCCNMASRLDTCQANVYITKREDLVARYQAFRLPATRNKSPFLIPIITLNQNAKNDTEKISRKRDINPGPTDYCRS